MDHPFDNFLKAKVILRQDLSGVREEMDKLGLCGAGSFDVHWEGLAAAVANASASMAAYVTGETDRRPRVNVIQKVILDTRLVTDPECEAVREAFRILDYAKVRETIEVMLLLGESVATVVGAINGKYGFGLTADGLECFRYYFWNTERMTRADFSIWIGSDAIETGRMPLHKQALTYEPSVVRARAGVSGPRKSYKQILDDTVAQAYDAFTTIMQNPGSEFSGEAISWFRFLGSLLKDAAKFSDEDEARKIIEGVVLELVERNTAAGLRDAGELTEENDRIGEGDNVLGLEVASGG